jgi:hypothetical protein
MLMFNSNLSFDCFKSASQKNINPGNRTAFAMPSHFKQKSAKRGAISIQVKLGFIQRLQFVETFNSFGVA